jgi:hypothetical protein
MQRLTFPLLLLLAGCGTPQEQCIRYNTRDLRTVDRLILETQQNLERGYAIETVTTYEDYWGYCAQPHLPDTPAPPPQLCQKERAITVDRPKAIDLNDEARKLDSLKVKRAELARKAEAVIAQCKAEHPE